MAVLLSRVVFLFGYLFTVQDLILETNNLSFYQTSTNVPTIILYNLLLIRQQRYQVFPLPGLVPPVFSLRFFPPIFSLSFFSSWCFPPRSFPPGPSFPLFPSRLFPSHFFSHQFSHPLRYFPPQGLFTLWKICR